MFDYLIKNGLIFDGSGSEPIETNIGIKGDRISYIGTDEIAAKEVIDAKGMAVSPGFIDTHAHSEFTIIADGRAQGKLSQGITTEINGNCGLSAAPLYGEALERRLEDLKELEIKERWSTFREYFDILKSKGIALNFATLCGHGNIRACVIGYKDTVPDKKAMMQMKILLSEALKDGAKGLSTGLTYPPGVYSNTDELIELSKVLSSKTTINKNGWADFVYASHLRSEGDALIEATEEVIRIGKEAVVNVHISHIKTAGQENWMKINKVIELIESAREEGVNLTCDRYPYIAASTDLDIVLPPWVYEGGIDEELSRLKDPKISKKIKSEIGFKDDNYWKGIYISSVNNNKWMEGENIFDIAKKMDKRPEDVLFEILIEEKLRAGAIFFSMSEGNLKRFLALPYTMIGSDSSARSLSGPTFKGKPHPRGFGSFARFIGRYIRDEGLMPVSEAIRKMTYLPALTFNLKERGLIKEGFYADISIFDYKKIIDKATFKDPYNKPDGIAYVFVNGSLALKEREFTGSLSGSLLI